MPSVFLTEACDMQDHAGVKNLHNRGRFCDALHDVPRKGLEWGADVPEAANVGFPLLREVERRRDMADEYAGCH